MQSQGAKDRLVNFSCKTSAKMNTSSSSISKFSSATSFSGCVLPIDHIHGSNSRYTVKSPDENNVTKQEGILLLEKAASFAYRDPYIDAVQVRTRSRSEKAGPRVKAGDHEPNPSYYSKTVHIEESQEKAEKWDLSDDDDDDSDWEYDDKDDYEGGKKKIYIKKHPKRKKGRRRRKKKKGYGQKKKKYDDHHQYNEKMNHYPRKGKKKVYVFEPKKGDYHHHDDHNNYHDEGHKYKKGKLVHLGGKKHHQKGPSLAGIMGYTLLCVNYLLLLQKPSYEKYDSDHHHYYPKYEPHDKMGMHSHHVKLSGPMILAHCSELSGPTTSSGLKLKTSASDISETKNPNSTSLRVPTEAAQTSYNTYRSPSTTTNFPPPSYYYTLSPSSYNGQQTSVGQPRSGLLSPIQTYLERLFHQSNSPQDQPIDYENEQLQINQPINIVGNPVRFNNNDRLLVSSLDRVGQTQPRLVSNLSDRRLVVGFNGQPQVVQTRDNLQDLRTRNVAINMRVASRRRFNNGQVRPVSLFEDEDLFGNRQVGLAVRAPIEFEGEREQMQADQPTSGTGNNTSQQQMKQQLSPGNNLALDLPDYALSGDSIELTCDHQIPVGRLYSMKWFKDSLEFYRFIPANGARAKSSLFLPDIRLDLARSNSQSLFLRNVTHRASGLYRCEVVSEGPNFETLSGEKRMQVYSLPDNGPQLSLLESNELVSSSIPLASSELNSQQLEANPLIRCSSARSSPAAQLRFLVNNRPIDLDRTVQNSTVSYSDGLESNVVTFQLVLTDFLMDLNEETNNLNSLDRAATLKSKMAPPKSANVRATDANSTTTTTTVKPNLAKDKPTRSSNANANVRFDDQPNKLRISDKLEQNVKEKVGQEAKTRKSKKGKQNTGRKEQIGANFNSDEANNEGVNGIDMDGLNEEAVEEEATTSSHPLPAQRDSDAGHQERKLAAETEARLVVAAESGQVASDVVDLKPNHKRPSSGPIATVGQSELLEKAMKTLSSGSNSSGANHQPLGPVGDESMLVKQEQRVRRPTTTTTGQIYSSYIKIKCTSLVPAVDYEMTSELSLPLTLFVPANRLSDAFRQQSSTSRLANGQEEAKNLQQPLRLRQPASEAASLFGQPIRQRLAGGSMQAPRAVLIDRLAQASSADQLGLLGDGNTSFQVASKRFANNGSSPSQQTRPTKRLLEVQGKF